MSNYSSGWSDWVWSDEHHQAYRYRLNENGEYDYQYSGDQDPTAPRANIPDLMNAFSNLSVDDSQYGSYGGYGPGVATSAGTHQQDHDYYSTSAAQPSSSSKPKGKSVDTGGKSSKKSSQGSKQTSSSSSKTKSRHRTKGSSRHDSHSESMYERENDPFNSDPFYRPPHAVDTPVPEETDPQQEAQAELPPEDAGAEYESYDPSGHADPQDDYQDTAQGYEAGYEAGYGRSEERYAQPDAYSSSKHSKHSRSSGKRKAGHRQKDRSATDFAEPYPAEPDESLQDMMNEAHGYGTGDPTMFASSSTAGPTSTTYAEDEYDEDQQATPTRARTPAGAEEDYAGEHYEQPGAEYASYPSDGGYETGQPSAYPDFSGTYAPPHESGYGTPQDSGYHSTQSGYDSVYGERNTYRTSGSTVIPVNPSGFGEVLDSRYTIQHSSRFAPGEVFKALWPEPLGGARRDADAPTEVEEHNNHLGQKIYVGFRRFIVVANDEGHCTCVPILTYERRGCTKRGLKPQKHGIVYAQGSQPVRLKNEPELGYDPICLVPYYSTEKLAKESRVNYSKLVTVEHNIKVFFIGRIARDDFDIVSRAVNECWIVKLHRPGETSSRKARK